MNSYGSVSRVSESIYKLLRYMNWVSSNDGYKVNDDDDDDDDDDNDAIARSRRTKSWC
jgi:hypothetical protein